MTSNNDWIRFWDVIPQHIVEKLNRKFFYPRGESNEARESNVVRHMNDLGYRKNLHLNVKFYDRYLHDLNAPFKVTIPIAYKTLQDLGYGDTVTLLRVNMPIYFTKLIRVSEDEVEIIYSEIKDRIKEYEVDFANEIIEPLEKIFPIVQAEMIPTRSWEIMENRYKREKDTFLRNEEKRLGVLITQSK